jgi:hypothetical protein
MQPVVDAMDLDVQHPELGDGDGIIADVNDEVDVPGHTARLGHATLENVRRRVWTNSTRLGTVTVEDSDESDSEDDQPDDDDNGDFLSEPDTEGEDELEGGLPPEDMINEEFERELAEIGERNKIPTRSPWLISRKAEELTSEDLDMLRAFALKTDEHLTEKAFSKMRFAFPSANLDSWKTIRSRVSFLAGLKPVLYDCCVNSCVCYIGPHADQTQCPFCMESRYTLEQKPRKRFLYVPLIPRLTAYFKNTSVASRMAYRSEFAHDPNIIKDVFDSSHYRSLLQQNVTVDGKRMPYKFFSDARDIALGLSTDGFAPFRRRKKTGWPLILFNYNLPPEIRFHLRHILCVGVIPGPKKPKDFDSFLWPLVVELLRLEVGVRAFDAGASELFALRAHLILVFGDMPAVSMVMCMKGHNGLFPCRMCRIKAVPIPNSNNRAHYVPMDRSSHPAVHNNPDEIQTYTTASLPLRTHEEFLDQARQVQFAETNADFERLSKQYGIKGVPLLSSLSSLSFPTSFPLDFMHLMYENVIKNLVLLWTGKYKDLDQGLESYELNKTVWEAIGEATADAGAVIPGAFGARPQNVADDKTACTADSWSFWALYLGPVVLRGRFLKRTYYDHFVELVKQIHVCLKFEVPRSDIVKLREGLQDWVKEYER